MKIETDDVKFFNKQKVFEDILAVTTGFIKGLKDSIDKGEIVMEHNEHTLNWKNNSGVYKQLNSNSCFKSKTPRPFLNFINTLKEDDVKKGLSFNSFCTFRSKDKY